MISYTSKIHSGHSFPIHSDISLPYSSGHTLYLFRDQLATSITVAPLLHSGCIWPVKFVVCGVIPLMPFSPQQPVQ